ncbi:hypothetical protein ILYODFUR_012768, partial [Ilyodon furcidens]
MSKETYAFCSWFGSGPVCIQTISEPHQSSFGSGPRPPQKVCLGPVVWSGPRLDYCVYLYFGLVQSSIHLLQLVHNAAACLLTGEDLWSCFHGRGQKSMLLLIGDKFQTS